MDTAMFLASGSIALIIGCFLAPIMREGKPKIRDIPPILTGSLGFGLCLSAQNSSPQIFLGVMLIGVCVLLGVRLNKPPKPG